MSFQILDENSKKQIKLNIEEIRSIISECEKRSDKGNKVTLLAATKTVPAEVINYATQVMGITDIGENRVQELLDKYDKLEKENIKIHFIGKLQTNKVKYIIDKVDLIHSLDSIKLAAEIDKQAKKHNKVMDVLIEINSGREENKSGILPEDVDDFIEKIGCFDNICVKGLMTIAPNCVNISDYKKYFEETYAKFIDICNKKSHNIKVELLSMGMSSSYQVAIESGSNIVRIGSSIFGERIYK